MRALFGTFGRYRKSLWPQRRTAQKSGRATAGRARGEKRRGQIAFEPLEERALLSISGGGASAREYVPGEVLLALRSDKEIPDFSAYLIDHEWPAAVGDVSADAFQIDYEFASSIDGYLTVGQLDLPSGADVSAVADQLSQLPQVAWAQPNYLLQLTPTATPNDPLFSQQYQHQVQDGGGNPLAGGTMFTADAWDTTQGSSNVVIAVLDSGVDYTHPDLAPSMWNNPGEIAGNGIDDDGNGRVDDVFGFDFCSNDGDPAPPTTGSQLDRFHGTHVAGIAAARINNNIGIAGTAGLSQIMALRASVCSTTLQQFAMAITCPVTEINAINGVLPADSPNRTR